MNKLRSYLAVFFVPGLLLCGSPLPGQAPELSEDFQTKLRFMRAEILLPLDSDYRMRSQRPDEFQPFDLGMESRKEKMEIRYLAYPQLDDYWAANYPHILAARTAAHTASNAEDSYMTQLSLGKKELKAFNADWGVEYVYSPKSQVTAHRYGKLLVLYKEGRGALLIFFFFDDPDNEAIDSRYEGVIFNG
ncbi:MAG: hypothetical protein IPH04_12495 [Saprospirales bacterium]|nr:hypothetical protein [Saprospirales bacterium]